MVYWFACLSNEKKKTTPKYNATGYKEIGINQQPASSVACPVLLVLSRSHSRTEFTDDSIDMHHEERGLSVAILRRNSPRLLTLSSSVWSWRTVVDLSIMRGGEGGQRLSVFIRRNVTHNRDFFSPPSLLYSGQCDSSLFELPIWEGNLRQMERNESKRAGRERGNATRSLQVCRQQQDKASSLVWGVKGQFIMH